MISAKTDAGVTFKDFFFTYGRRESLCFVGHLHRALRLKGYEVWFDKANIPDGEDYAERINHGIESAHNFIVVMAPRCMTSPYCLIELEYARILGKRVIPINQMAVSQIEETPLPEKRIQLLSDFYRFHDIPDRNIRTNQDVLNRFHALIGKTDRLDGKMTLTEADCAQMDDWARPYENNWRLHDDPEYLEDLDLPLFGTCVDDMALVIERVMAVAERQKSYVHTHTELLFQALLWEKNQRAVEHLLAGKDRLQAEDWLLTEFIPPKQPPCTPSVLHAEFICESRKNSEDMMTDVFICCHKSDREGRDSILRSLFRHAFTAWTRDRDIRKGDDPGRASEEAIANADNFFFLISPESVASENCMKALAIAQAYRKRILPVLIAQTPVERIPEQLRGLESVDFSRNVDQLDFNRDIDAILHILKHDRVYFREHKFLLCRALQWAAHDRQDSFLLRGHNLENARTWLRLNADRQRHPPTDLHRELITASEAKRGQLGSDVFISYSRKDGDFARKLNNALQEAGKTTWFDQGSISKGVDFRKEIYKGIASSDNFLFIISPDAVTSKYCAGETAYAAELSKRFITVRRRRTNPDLLSESLRMIQWIDFETRPFDEAFSDLIQAVDLDREHARRHTTFQQRASEWADNDRSGDFLLNRTACERGEAWLGAADAEGKQPAPTDLQRAHIARSRQAIEDAERAGRRRRRIAFTAVLAGLIIALVLAGMAFIQRNRAEKQRRVAVGNYRQIKANELAHVSGQLRNEGDYTRAIRVAQAACEVDPRHVPPAAQQALIDAYNKVTLGDSRYFYQNVLPHGGSLNMAAFSPDGRAVVTASSEGAAVLWTPEGRHKATLAHGASVRNAVFSADGSRIVTIGDASMLRIWSADGGLIKDLRGRHGCDGRGNCHVAAAAFSPNGRRFVSAGADGGILLWDADGNLLHRETNAHYRFAHTVRFSPDGACFATASWGRYASVKLWDGRTGAHLVNITEDACPHVEGGRCGLSAILFSADGRRLIAASANFGVRVFDRDGRLRKTLDAQDAEVRVLIPTPDGKGVAAGTQDGEIIEWDGDGTIRRRFSAHAGAVMQLTYSPDGGFLLSAGADHAARLWDAHRRLLIDFRRHSGAVHSAFFSPDQQTIVTASYDRTARLWSVQNELPPIFPHEGEVAAAMFLPDERRILTGVDRPGALLWDVATRSIIRDYGTYGSDDDGNRRLYALDLSPDGKRFVTASSDYRIRIQDVETGRIIKTWDGGHRWNCAPGGRCGVANVVWSPDGGMIASADFAGDVALWDASGDPIRRFTAHDAEIKGLAVSPDSRFLLTGSVDHALKLWTIEGELVRIFDDHQGGVNRVAFSPDGKWIASASDDFTARLRRTEGDDPPVILDGHAGHVACAAFSPAGDRLITASGDNTARIWDLDGNLIRVLSGHDAWLRTAFFSPSGKTALTASADSRARIWTAARIQTIYDWVRNADIYRLNPEERREFGIDE